MAEDGIEDEKTVLSELGPTGKAATRRADRLEERLPAVLTSIRRYHAGPLPPPDLLQSYEEVLPELADRIVTVAEEQARHRHEGDRHDRKMESPGHAFGFVIALFSFIVAGALIALDRPLHGMGAVIAAVGGLSGLCVWSRSSSAKKGLGLPGGTKGGQRSRDPQGG